MDALKGLLHKNRSEIRELAAYIAVGALTTAVNYGVYVVLRRFAGLSPTMANPVAWVASVAFAYVANRFFVFHTRNVKGTAMVKEAVLFAAARVMSLLLEMGILWLFAEKIGLNDYWVKLAANAVVIAVNYFLSKLMIFRKKE